MKRTSLAAGTGYDALNEYSGLPEEESLLQASPNVRLVTVIQFLDGDHVAGRDEFGKRGCGIVEGNLDLRRGVFYLRLHDDERRVAVVAETAEWALEH